MRQWGRGREAAFDVLLRRHGGAIKAYALRMLRSAEQAEDIYVETFVRAARAGSTWQNSGTVRGFLFTVAHRLCLDVLRRRKTEREAMPGLIALAECRAVDAGPEAMAVLGQQARQLEAALQRLPDEHRQALLLRVVHGLSGDEVAATLGLSRAQVDSQVSYARKRLKKLLTLPAVAGGGWR